jgi:hypothetical protein
MKALTVRQPWATLLVTGRKRIETRSRDTKHRGPLVIHAGTAMPCRIGQRVTFGEYEVERDRSGLLMRSGSLGWPYRLPLGAIVGVVNVIYTRPTDSLECAPGDDERTLGDYSPGRFAWYTDSLARRIRPVSWKGALGLWTVPDEAVAALRTETAA